MTWLKNLTLTLLLTTLSCFNAANAVLISYNGYTLNTETDIVTGGGLEWLQWDVTVGESINSAIAANGIFGGVDYGTGWTLATNVQMAALFAAFGFNSTTDERLISVTVGVYTPDEDDDIYDKFIELYGVTVFREGPIYSDGVDADKRTQALYGSDENQNGWYNYAAVTSDYAFAQGRGDLTRGSRARQLGEGISVFSGSSEFGVALVRSVAEPSTVAILAMGLFGLGLGRRFRTSIAGVK